MQKPKRMSRDIRAVSSEYWFTRRSDTTTVPNHLRQISADEEPEVYSPRQDPVALDFVSGDLARRIEIIITMG
jgi:hypothetical protein